jgi:hypothetical protein
LDQLSTFNLYHIPKIIFHSDSTLGMTPLGEKERYQRYLSLPHQHGIIHRYSKIYFLRNLDDNSIFIIDWGYSIYDSEIPHLQELWNVCQTQLINGTDIVYGPKTD